MLEPGELEDKFLRLVRGALERDGIVNRPIFPISPPQVECRLTELGRLMSEPALAFGRCVT